MTNYQSAATAILKALGATPTPTNMAIVVSWISCEKPAGEPWQWNNPLNTTEPGFGETGIMNSEGVRAYATETDGARAIATTMRNGHYPHLLAGILRSNAQTFFSAEPEMATWGTSYYCVHSGYIARPSIVVPGVTSSPSPTPSPNPVPSPGNPTSTPGQPVAYTPSPLPTIGLIALALGIAGTGIYLVERR